MRLITNVRVTDQMNIEYLLVFSWAIFNIYKIVVITLNKGIFWSSKWSEAEKFYWARINFIDIT